VFVGNLYCSSVLRRMYERGKEVVMEWL